MTRMLLRVSIVLVVMLGVAVAEPRPWQDPRLRTWATAFQQGRHAEVIAAVERDLRSRAPHPFAAHVWVVTHDLRGTLARAAADADGSLKAALGALPDMYLRSQLGDTRAMLADARAAKPSALDAWSLTLLVWASEQVDTRLALAEERLRRSPDFLAAWDYIHAVERGSGDPALLARARAAIAAAPIAGTAVAGFLDAMARHGTTHVDQLAAIDAVLRASREPYALTYRANLISTHFKRHAEAAQLHEEHDRLYPWTLSFRSQARALLQAGRRADAQRVIAAGARRFGAPGVTLEQRIAREWSRALLEAGERGDAKQQLDAAVKKWPQDAELWDRLRQYWRAPNDEGPARRAVELEPTRARRAALATILATAQRRDDALALYDRLASEGDPSAGGTIYERLGMTAERVAWHEARLREAPRSAHRQHELARAYADARRLPDAVKTLLASFAIEAPTASSLDALVKWIGDDATTIERTLEALRARFPWNEAVAGALAARRPSAERAAVFERATRDAPALEWPWRRRIELLVEAKRWDDVERLVLQAKTALARAPAGQRALALRTAAWVVVRRAEVAPALVDEGLARVRAYEQAQGAILDVLALRESLVGARPAEACAVARQRDRLDPDGDAWHFIALRCSDVAPEQGRIAVRRYVQRDPDDPARLSELVRLMVFSWSAPVSALLAIERLRVVAPNADVTRYEAFAFGQLGDHGKAFAKAYADAALASSTRYIDWYESARRNAREGGNTVALDAAAGTASITYPTGEVVVRREHPISGRVVELRRGTALVRGDYDPTGYWLQRLVQGDLVTEIERDTRGRLVQYTMRAKGYELGHLRLGYAADGQVSRLELRDLTSGRTDIVTAGSKADVRARVEGALARIEDRVAKFAKGELPEVPQADFALDTLRAELRAQKDPAKAIVQRIALVRALLAKARPGNDHAREASDHLEQLAEEPADDVRLAVAELEHQRLLAQFPDGVALHDYERHAARVDRLRATLLSGPHAARAATVLRTLESQPLGVRDSDRVLPRTDHATEQRWTTYGLDTLLPSAARGARPRAVLLRTSGEIVVGTTRGLLIRRDGAWRWYGFDPSARRWSPTAARLDGRSDVRALAEVDGSLYVGSAGGLHSARDLDDSPEEHARVAISALARSGATVVAGTARGALRVDARGAHQIQSVPPEPVVSIVEGSGGDTYVATASGAYRVDLADAATLARAAGAKALHLDTAAQTLWWVGAGGLATDDKRAAALPQLNVSALGQIWIAGQSALLVVGDRAGWVRIGSRFEWFDVPAVTEHAIEVIASRPDLLVLAGPQAISVWEPTASILLPVRTDELLTMPALGMTLARTYDHELYAIAHRSREVKRIGSAVLRIARHSATSVALAHASHVATLDLQSGRSTKLFDLPIGATVTDLLVAHDGAVWAVARAWVFRHAGGKTEVHSVFKDRYRFPARSDMLGRVVETADRKIWVVASNEQHRMLDGVPLDGGLLEYDGRAFRMIGKPGAHWFATSYTPIADGEGIVGSTAGFALHRGGHLVSFLDDLQLPSVRDLLAKQRQRMILGTRGVPVGRDSWLFGTSAGLVLYQRGPDRLADRWHVLDGVGELLPERHLADRGSRHVHAVEVDPDGRVYIATDAGVTLLPAGLATIAAVDADARIEEHALQPATVDPRRRALVDRIVARSPDTRGSPVPMTATARAQLDDQIAAGRAGLAPVPETASRLAADHARIRIVPMDAAVSIEVTAGGRTVSRRVRVARRELEARAARAALRLQAPAAGVRGIARSTLASHGQPPLDDELAWLYDVLLRPIEPLLEGTKAIEVVAAGGLRELPLGALVRTRAPRPEQAAARFPFR